VPSALLVILLGVGIGAFGLLEPDMYVIGIVVVLIGMIGVAVRLVDWLRWLRDALL
jgi:hypothetical protein